MQLKTELEMVKRD